MNIFFEKDVQSKQLHNVTFKTEDMNVCCQRSDSIAVSSPDQQAAVFPTNTSCMSGNTGSSIQDYITVTL